MTDETEKTAIQLAKQDLLDDEAKHLFLNMSRTIARFMSARVQTIERTIKKQFQDSIFKVEKTSLEVISALKTYDKYKSFQSEIDQLKILHLHIKDEVLKFEKIKSDMNEGYKFFWHTIDEHIKEVLPKLLKEGNSNE